MKALAGLFGGGSSRSSAQAAPAPGAAVAPVDTTAANKPDVAAAGSEVGSTGGADSVGIGNTINQNTRTKRAAVPGLGL